MKRKLYFGVKKYVNSDNIKVVILAIPLAIILIEQIVNGEFNWADFFDISILITFMFLAICDGIVKIVQRKVAENTEDFAKLTEEYGNLTKKYSSTNLVNYHGVIYPEECLWMRKGNEKIVIEDSPEKFYQLPQQVSDNSKEIMEAHSASTIYNQINIRLDNIKDDVNNNRVVLQTSRTQFYDSLLTNRACDYVFSDRKTTVRELYEPGPFLKPLALSKMSEYSLGKAIVGELMAELHITSDRAVNAENAQNSIFAFYRDLVECGKPQFLFCLQLKDMTEDNLRKLITENGRKLDKNDTTTDGDKVCFFSVEQLNTAKFYVDKIEIEGKVYKMMPSSVVSIVLLLKYLQCIKEDL